MLNEDHSIKGYLAAGDVIYIEALAPHAGEVLEDTEIVYILIQ